MQTDRQTERWTDMTKELVAFRDYANAPKGNLKVTSTENCGPIVFHIYQNNVGHFSVVRTRT